MLPEAKQRLIRLYTMITGAILTIVVIMAFIITIQMNKNSSKELFLRYFDMILSKVRQESVISSTWLSELAGDQGIIQIWDNGRPLVFPGEKNAQLENHMLFDCLKRGKNEKADPETSPVTDSEQTSGIFELKGEQGRRYFGKIGVVRVKGGYRGLIYIRPYSKGWSEVTGLFLWFLFFIFLGIAALCGFNRLFIGRVLEPVEKSRKQQAEFIAAVSHELRSPLAVMKANLAAMESRTEQKADFARLMRMECERLNSLVEDLLLLASADAGKWHVEKESVDSEGLLIELYESYEPVFKRQGIHLLVEFPQETLPEFLGDRKRMQQILAILLSNALRFSPEDSYVLLKGEADKNKRILRLLVIDHGKGVPEPLREKVFERFYQADLSRGEKEHFGLGLSIARELAELQGGRLFCEETKKGGATFVFSVHF